MTVGVSGLRLNTIQLLLPPSPECRGTTVFVPPGGALVKSAHVHVRTVRLSILVNNRKYFIYLVHDKFLHKVT